MDKENYECLSFNVCGISEFRKVIFMSCYSIVICYRVFYKNLQFTIISVPIDRVFIKDQG